MHNAHFIICNGEDADKVRCNIEYTLDNWGDENNWYDIRRIIDVNNMSADDKKYLQETLNDLNNEFSQERIDKTKERIKECYEHASDEQRHYYYQLSIHCQDLYEMLGQQGKKLTIDNLAEAKDFHGGQYDEFGLTNAYYAEDDEDDEEKLFFVEIDMHS